MNTANTSNTSVNAKYIDIQGVEQTFKTKKGPFCALQNVNLTVAKGEFEGRPGF